MLWCEVLSVVFIIITCCCGKISINFTVNSHENIDIKFYGDDNNIITEKEINLFGLNNDNLKWGVRVELGRIPDEVFLKNPTPYGDLYTKYGWQEVKRNLRVKSAKVIEIFKEKAYLKTDVFINNTSEPMKTKAKEFKRVENTVYSLWSASGWPMDEIVYDVNINFGNGNLSYENSWRNRTIRNIYLPIGVSKIGDVIITPGKEIVLQLSAFKVVAVIEIIYEARLVGHSIANFARVYGKYHFWAPNINNIMSRVNIKNKIETSEIIEIRCYTSPVLKIFDKLSGETIKIVYKPRKDDTKKVIKDT